MAPSTVDQLAEVLISVPVPSLNSCAANAEDESAAMRGSNTAQPAGGERFNEAEVFQDEVSHVPQHQIAGKDVLRQIVADGFVLLGAGVELMIDNVAVEQIEGEVHFAAGGFAVLSPRRW